jgi:hypothetical protein
MKCGASKTMGEYVPVKRLLTCTGLQGFAFQKTEDRADSVCYSSLQAVFSRQFSEIFGEENTLKYL